MNKQIIHTDAAPAAVGPYSQAVRTGQMLYTAGQVAIIPGTGQLVEGDVTPQTEQVLRNLTAVLAAAGTDLSHIVKTTVFLQDMADFAAMNAVYAAFFGPNPPARSTVAVAGLPLGARVEIEAVAIIPG
jgi:2-iminobutanoate/2-iminopropanoate deaminase